MADAVVILAGGEATRFPGKLERDTGGEPLLLRVYRNVRGNWPVYIAAKGSFPTDIDARLECPVLVDRWPTRGPLAALLSACGALREDRIFAVAADLPHVDRALLERLAGAWMPGDEAVVPSRDGRLEPLAALYDRRALLEAGFAAFSQGRAAMHDLVERLRTRFVSMPAGALLNVNFPADLQGVS
jgi:molybdenum cofactor guanylyltransferase